MSESLGGVPNDHCWYDTCGRVLSLMLAITEIPLALVAALNRALEVIGGFCIVRFAAG